MESRKPSTSLLEKPFVKHYQRKMRATSRWMNKACVNYEFDLPPVKIPVKGKRFTFITIPAFNYGLISKN